MTDPSARRGSARSPGARTRTIATLVLGAGGFAWALWFIRDRLGDTLLFTFGIVVGTVGGVGVIAARKRRSRGWLIGCLALALLGVALVITGARGMIEG